MPLFSLTGTAKSVKDALMARVRHTHETGDHDILLLVPGQYTLQAEMDALGEGSFRLQVLSPGRLFSRIFDSAGWPHSARIDEQGRVMLVHAAAERLKPELVHYRRAVGRRGFAEKVLTQLSGFKQAHKTPDDVRAMAEAHPNSVLGRKLMDLALLYEDYEAALLGRFLDGEDEARLATARIAQAAFIRGAEVYVYGFDIVSQPLAEALVALCPLVRHVTVAMTIGTDERDLYATVRRSRDRLVSLAKEAGIDVQHIEIESNSSWGAADIRHLERWLYCFPNQPCATSHIQLAALKNPQDEAEFAAALVRQLVMERNWRWRDVAVMAQNLDDQYAGALRRAFAQAQVPLFLPTSRPADRHPAAQCLLCALRLLSNGWRTEDMVGYLRTGFSGLEDDALDQLINHIIRRGLRGRSLKNPLRALAEGQESLEAWREQAVAPLLTLEQQTRRQSSAKTVLTAMFEFIDGLDMCGRLEQRSDELVEMGQREWAMEGPQVYARILAAMDQMAELLSAERLPLRAAAQLMERALAVAEIKPLPQSGDAVLCGSADHMKTQDVQALLILGLTDQSAPTDAGLLNEIELGELGGAHLSASLSPLDRQRMARLSIKSALSFTGHYLLISRPMSNAKGEAVKPSPLIAQLRRICPGLHEHGGQSLREQDRRMRYMRLNAPIAAMVRLGAMLGETPNDPYLIAMRDALGDDGADDYITEPHVLPSELATKLFGELGMVSVTRLERYVQCPYQHFVHYALKPEAFEPFQLSPRDAGNFYHDAMNQFLSAHGAHLASLSQAESMTEMDAVTAPLMDELFVKSLGDGAVARAEADDLRRVARRAAAAVVHHMRGSKFMPTALEIDFGQAEPRIKLSNNAHLGGRIDRIDSWSDGEEPYLRVIDYKTGGKHFEMSKVFYGLQMQLMIYLAAAAKQQNGRPAGAFYFTISDKLVDADSTDPELIEHMRDKEMMLTGALVADERIQAAMSDHPQDVLPSARSSGVMAEDELRLVMDHAVSKARHAYGKLRQGIIEPQPVHVSGYMACDYCDYRTVCRRNPREPVPKLPSLRRDEALDLMRKEEESDELEIHPTD